MIIRLTCNNFQTTGKQALVWMGGKHDDWLASCWFSGATVLQHCWAGWLVGGQVNMDDYSSVNRICIIALTMSLEPFPIKVFD